MVQKSEVRTLLQRSGFGTRPSRRIKKAPQVAGPKKRRSWGVNTLRSGPG